MVGLDVDRSRAFWWSIGAVLLVVVLFVVYTFLGTFVFAVFLYYATRPVYERIRRRVGQPTLAASLALFVFALPAVALLAYTIAIALQEFSNLQGVDLGPLRAVVDPYVDVSGIVEDPASILSDSAGLDAVESSLRAGLDYLGFIANGLLHLFVILALAFYMLRDGGRLTQWTVKFGDDRGILDSYVRAVDQALANIFFGNILNAIVTGIIGAISFNVLNLFAPSRLAIPYPALTGLLTGVGSLIPVVGMKIVYVPVIAYIGLRSAMQGTGYGFVITVGLVTFFIVDALPDFVLRPYVSGRNLHVGLVMFAYILGPLIFGWYGIFLGPLLLVLVFHFGRIVVPELLTGRPIRPGAVDPGTLADPPPPSEGSEPPPDADACPNSASDE